MSNYSYITVEVVRKVLEVGAASLYTTDLKAAVGETFSAWQEDQNNEELDGRAYAAREDAIIDLEDLDAYDIETGELDRSQELTQKIWTAVHKYWTN